jgi:hypothetical protein
VNRSLGWWRVLPLLFGLPMLGGAAVCGVALVDITQRDLILEPVETIDFDVDSGAVEVYASDRNGISLFSYMVGSLYDIGDVGFYLEGDHLDVVTVCERTDFCNVNWYAEVMLGTSVDVRTGNGAVKLSGVDAPITAEVVGGGFDGVELRAPTLEIDVEEGDVAIEWLEPPTSAAITVGTGAVSLTLPEGSYRCDLATAEGEVVTTGITCDDASTNLVHVDVEAGDITLAPGAMP